MVHSNESRVINLDVMEVEKVIMMVVDDVEFVFVEEVGVHDL